MLEFPTWKKIWLWSIALIAMFAAIPSLTSNSGLEWPDALPDPEINLGLDLAGGSHLLLEAKPEQVAQQRLENVENAVENALRDAEPRIRFGDASRSNGRFSLLLNDAADLDRARGLIEPIIAGTDLTLSLIHI